MFHCDLSFLYRNLSNVKISKSNFNISKLNPLFSTVATYDTIRNKIATQDEKSIYHELFHLSSSYYAKDKNTIFTGFRQRNAVHSIGKGINEGYTELLCERYFNDKDINSAYYFGKIIVKSLENIVEKEKMENLYMQADLYNLINELKKYNNEEEDIITFIKDLDYICDNIDISNILSKKRNKKITL